MGTFVPRGQAPSAGWRWPTGNQPLRPGPRGRRPHGHSGEHGGWLPLGSTEGGSRDITCVPGVWSPVLLAPGPLSAPRAAALCGAPAAGGGQTGVSGGRGFIFSPTASVILSLWRYWAGAHQAPPVVPQAAGLLCGDLSGCVCVHVCARVRARQRDRDVPCGLGQGCFASLAGLHFLT